MGERQFEGRAAEFLRSETLRYLADWGNLPPDPGCHEQALAQDFAPGVGGFISLFSAYSIKDNWPLTVGIEAVKYGLPALGMALGKPALKAVGLSVGAASLWLSMTATAMDARGGTSVANPFVP